MRCGNPALPTALWLTALAGRVNAVAMTTPDAKSTAVPDTDAADRPVADMNFEDALHALEDVVRRLESGDVPLDDSIDLYERGEKLRQRCQARLNSAQSRIESIVAGPDGAATGTKAFDDNG